MDMIKVTGLWKAKDKNGETYLSGSLNPITQLAVMPNAFKRNEKDPDYFVYLRESKKKMDAETPKGNSEAL